MGKYIWKHNNISFNTYPDWKISKEVDNFNDTNNKLDLLDTCGMIAPIFLIYPCERTGHTIGHKKNTSVVSPQMVVLFTAFFD